MSRVFTLNDLIAIKDTRIMLLKSGMDRSLVNKEVGKIHDLSSSQVYLTYLAGGIDYQIILNALPQLKGDEALGEIANVLGIDWREIC